MEKNSLAWKLISGSNLMKRSENIVLVIIKLGIAGLIKLKNRQNGTTRCSAYHGNYNVNLIMLYYSIMFVANK